jgi:N-acetylglucosaminyldiphosphoundecaprenol N-acetyl-beta-D-mannosaminyltransferase
MTTAASQLSAYELLGVTVNAIDVPTLFALIEDVIRTGDRRIISYHNLHSIYLYHHDLKMRRFYGLASCLYVDGTPIIYLGQLLGYPLGYRHRITSLHWIRPLLAHGASQGWRTFLLGGNPGTAAHAARILENEIPGVQIETAHGYFDAARTTKRSSSVSRATVPISFASAWVCRGRSIGLLTTSTKSTPM